DGVCHPPIMDHVRARAGSRAHYPGCARQPTRGSPTVPFPLDLPESELRRRRSQKWVAHPEDVLSRFGAEIEFLLAPAIRERLAAAVADGDAGFFAEIERLAGVCAGYYSRFGYRVPPESVVPVNDVGVGVRETLARTLP